MNKSTLSKAKNFVSRDDILNAPDLPLVEVEVPEWGGSVHIRGLTGTERDWVEAEILGGVGKERLANARAKVVSLALVDEDGNPLFSKADVEALGKKNGKVIDRLFQAIRKESGLLDEDLDELVKNFVSDLKEDSTSS